MNSHRSEYHTGPHQYAGYQISFAGIIVPQLHVHVFSYTTNICVANNTIIVRR